jgi:hypothetical protein
MPPWRMPGHGRPGRRPAGEPRRLVSCIVTAEVDGVRLLARVPGVVLAAAGGGGHDHPHRWRARRALAEHDWWGWPEHPEHLDTAVGSAASVSR